MTELDDLLRSFRTNVPDPAPGAAARVAARLQGGRAPSISIRRRRPARLVAIAACVAGAASIAVALWPDERTDETSVPSAGNLLARAEAAVAPPNRIVALSVRIRRQSPDEPAQTIAWREWSLAGAGEAMLVRLVITEKPLDRPPTDEDSTILVDRRGRIVDQRSWTPNADGRRGTLSLGGPPRRAGDPPAPRMASILRWAYQRRILRPAGRTREGALRLRGPSIFGGPCGHTEVDLDPKTFVPRRLESVSTEGAAQQGQNPCGSGGQTTREVWTIESVRYLPATAENRRLLRIGDWPVARAQRWAGTDERGLPKYEPLKRVPPVPPLDEG